MIEKQYGKFVVVCDNCGESGEGEYYTFEDAVNDKKSNGYISRKYSNGWKDLCKDCQD